MKRQKRTPPETEPLHLAIYPGGVAALWREKSRFRFYCEGAVLIDTEVEDDAWDVVYEWQDQKIAELEALGLIRPQS